MTIEFVDNKNRFFEDVKILGRKNSATLGFMPEGGFDDHAKNKCIIIAHDGETLAGYLMFRVVSRFSRISIVHLCVSEEYRGKGISTALLDALKSKYEKVYRGISLSCRTDFDYASSVWRNFGFVPREKVRSRSFDENYLNRWWYDFNQPDLFSVALTSKVKALLDMNIIIKLRDAENTEFVSPQEDPRGLLADWLTDEAELCFAPEAYNEIDRDRNLQRAARTRTLLSSFTPLHINIEEQKNVVQELEQIIGGKSENDISDRKQIASCIVSQTPYFITYDERLLNKRELIEKQYSIQIYNPQEFIMQVDQLLHGEEYLPSQLKGVISDFVSKPTPQELSNCVNKFWMQKEGEDKQTFNALISELINKNKGVLYVLKRDGDAIAFYGITEKEDSTYVELLRICDKDICNALFFQIISNILERNIKSGRSQIVFREKYITTKQKDILDKFGFVLQNNLYVKYVYNIIVTKEEVSNIIKQSYPSITIEYDGRQLLEVERKLFPLKIKGLNIPTYIIPIMPYWAGQLFDLTIAGEDLFGANPEKLWSFENVYYRHTQPIKEKCPARILWYVSGRNNRYSHAKSIVASSYLTDVITGKPKDLFHANRRYGIYEWKDIFNLCHGDINMDIRVLRFCHTEVFEYPVSFAKIQEILFANGRRRNTFASPVEINDTIYFQLYQLGKWKEQK